MARPDKVAAVAELTEAFRGSTAAVLTEYRGLTVAQLKELRRSLTGNATYSVVKNTLTKIAAREAGFDSFDALLEGPSAIAFVTGDPVEVAKGLRAFGREIGEVHTQRFLRDGLRRIVREEIHASDDRIGGDDEVMAGARRDDRSIVLQSESARRVRQRCEEFRDQVEFRTGVRHRAAPRRIPARACGARACRAPR